MNVRINEDRMHNYSFKAQRPKSLWVNGVWITSAGCGKHGLHFPVEIHEHWTPLKLVLHSRRLWENNKPTWGEEQKSISSRPAWVWGGSEYLWVQRRCSEWKGRAIWRPSAAVTHSHDTDWCRGRNHPQSAPAAAPDDRIHTHLQITAMCGSV